MATKKKKTDTINSSAVASASISGAARGNDENSVARAFATVVASSLGQSAPRQETASDGYVRASNIGTRKSSVVEKGVVKRVSIDTTPRKLKGKKQQKYQDLYDQYYENRRNVAASRDQRFRSQLPALEERRQAERDEATRNRAIDMLRDRFSGTGATGNTGMQRQNRDPEYTWDSNAYRMRITDLQDRMTRSGWLSNDENTGSAAERAEVYKSITQRLADIDDELSKWTNYYEGHQMGIYINRETGEKMTADEFKEMMSEKQYLEAQSRMYERTQSAVDRYSGLSASADYARLSAGRNVGNPTREEMAQANAAGRELAVPDKLGMFLAASDADIGMANITTNNLADYAEPTYRKILREGEMSDWKQLTDGEIDNYYYIFNSQGPEVAQKYLDDMAGELGRRRNAADIQTYENASIGEQLAYNIATLATAQTGGLAAVIDAASAAVQGKEYNPYSYGRRQLNFTQNVRGVTAEKIDEAAAVGSVGMGEAPVYYAPINRSGNLPTGQLTPSVNGITAEQASRIPGVPTAGAVYQSLMSGLDSFIGATGFGRAYTPIMGMGAAASQAQELYEKGASTEQIIIGSILSGTAEAAFEYISLDHFLDNAKSVTGMRDVVRNIFSQGGVEASEEMCTEVANTFIDVLNRKSQSDWEQLRDQGGFKHAFLTTLSNVIDAGVGGFVSGAAMAGAGGMSNLNAYIADMAQTGEEAMNTGAFQYALDYAQNNEVSPETQDLMQKATETQNATTEDIGRFVDAVNSEIREGQTKAEIREQMESSGAEVSDEMVNAIYDRMQSDADIRPARAAVREASDRFAESEEFQKNVQERVKAESQRTYDEYAGRVAEKAKSSTVDEITQAARAKTSDTGSATVDGQDVEISRIKSINKDGTMTLVLNNNTEVSSADIQYANETQALLYSAAQNLDMDAETANIAIKGFADSPVSDPVRYMYGMNEGINYGRMNIPTSSALKHGFFRELSEGQQKIAYQQGRTLAMARTLAAQNRIDARLSRTFKNKGKITYRTGSAYDALTERQKVSIGTVARTVSAAVNTEVILYETVLNENGKRVLAEDIMDADGFRKGDAGNANGMYKDGKIYLDINAGNNGEGVILWTFAHEATHYVKEWSPTKFQVLADYLAESYAETGTNMESLVQAKMAQLDLDHETAYEEVVADSMERMFTDTNLEEKLLNLANKDRTLFEKIRDAIVSLFDKIKALYKDVDAQTREGQLVHQMGDRLEKLSDMFAEAIVEAGQANGRATDTDTVAVIEDGGYVDSRVEQINGQQVTLDANTSTEGMRVEMMTDGAETPSGQALFQYRAMENDIPQYRQLLMEHGTSAEDCDRLFVMVNRIMDVIKDNLAALDYAWEADIDDRSFNPVKPNSDPLYKKSVDFSTLCRKRILQQLVQIQLQTALNRAISREESIAIRNELMKVQQQGREIEVACALCYVESARMKSPVQIQKFLDDRENVLREFFTAKDKGNTKIRREQAEMRERQALHDQYAKEIVAGDMKDPMAFTITAKGKKVYTPLNQLPGAVKKQIQQAKKAVAQTYQYTAEEQALVEAAKDMTVSDFTTPDGLAALVKNYPRIYDAYISYVRNATHSKGIEGDIWWRFGDSFAISDDLIAAMNTENGLRSQSWSDYQVIHTLDYIAAIIELSARKAKMQVYTKVPDYVKLMGNTGQMINLSLIPTREFNGSLAYDPVEGMPFEKALELRNKYHATAGTICIGMNDQQIKMLLDSALIDYVIPYHHSGMSKAVRHAMNIPTWTSYQEVQEPKRLDGARAEENAKKYGVTLMAASNPEWHKAPTFSQWIIPADMQRIANDYNSLSNKDLTEAERASKKKYGVMFGTYMAMQQAAENYKRMCAERGLAPQFSYGKGDFSNEENYWKLLIDRKMIDNVTGEFIVQQAVRPVFNEQDIMEILNDEIARYEGVQADQNYATRSVVEKFLTGNMNDEINAIQKVTGVAQTAIDNVTKASILGTADATEDLSASNGETVKYSVRTEPAPQTTQKAYKLMRLVDGHLYPLFIGNNERIDVGTWYDADSPNLSMLRGLDPGTHLINMETGEAVSWEQYAEEHLPKKNGKPVRSKPNVDDIHWANENGCRFMYIEDKAGTASAKSMQKKYGDTRAYYNWGVNGSAKTKSGEGSASIYALRPGWHFGAVPSMRQIGYGDKGDEFRLDNQVWVEVEMAADIDYQEEANSNATGDIPTHIPVNGYYTYATNPTQKKTKSGNTEADRTKADWYVAGAFKPVRILSDTEADAIVERYNAETGSNIPLDYRRLDGRVFNAETMQVENGKIMFSERAEYRSEISDWDKQGRPDNAIFVMGTTGELLQSLGVQERDIYIRGQKINTIFADHSEMSIEDIKRIPKILDNPILILKSQNSSGVSNNSRLVVFGKEKAANAKPIMVVFDVRPHERDFEVSDMNKVVSSYTKTTNPVDFIKNSDVLYVSENKKVATSLLQAIGFHMPITWNKVGYMGNVTYGNRRVNISGEPFPNVIQNNGTFYSLRDTSGRTLSPGQQEYFKDSKVRDADGNLLVVYHGTDAEFTVFDRSKGRSTMDIQGSFFSPWEDDAGGYGSNVQAYYLNITNPADEATAYKALRKFQGQNNAGVKAREYLASLGYDGVNNNDEEYIAFYPEQIKMVDNLNPTDDPDIRFSERNYEFAKRVEATNRTLQKMNTKLQEDNAYLQELVSLQRKVTNGSVITKPSLNTVTGKVMHYANAKGERAELSELLMDVYDYIRNGENITWDEIAQKAEPAVNWLMYNRASGAEYTEEAQKVFDYLKGKRVYISPENRAEIESMYGDYNDVRRSLQGKVTLTSDKSAIPLDTVWGELSGQFPWLFDADTNPGDQPGQLYNTIMDLQQQDRSPEEMAYYGQMMRDDFLQKIYDEYWNLATLRTVADRYQKQINKLKYNHIQKMRELRQVKNERMEDIRKMYQDRMKRYRDRAGATTLRGKIRAIRDDMQRRLLNPTERKYIPAPLVNGVIEVANQIDPTGKRQDTQVAEKYRSGLAALSQLKLVYDSLQNSPNYDFSSEFSKEFSDKIGELATAVGDTPLRDMTNDQLQDVYDIMNDIRHMIRDATRQIGTGEAITNYEAGMEMISEMEEVGKIGLNKHRISAAFRNFTENPLRAVREMTGFNEDSRLNKLFTDLNNGIRKGNKWKMDQSKAIEALRAENEKAFRDAVEKPFDFGLTDVEGKPLKISKMQAMQLVMTWTREQSNEGRKHLQNLTIIPDVDLQRKGKVAEAYEKHQKMAPINQKTIDTITSKLSDWDLRFIEAARGVFAASSDAINETTMQTKHRPVATEKEYIPYEVADDYLAKESENVKFDATIEGIGALKAMKNNAPQPIVMRGLNSVLSKHMDTAAKIYGLMIPVRNINKALNVRQTEADGGVPVKEAIRKVWGAGGLKLIDQAIADVQGSRPGENSRLLNAIKSGFVTSTLASNISVWMKQAASYPTAGSILSAGSLVKGLARYTAAKSAKVWAEIDQHTAQHWNRRQGMSTQELGDFNQSTGWVRKLSDKMGKLSPMNWIQAMDVATTAALWEATKAEVESKNKNLEKGSDEYWNAVTELYDRVIEETQPMYDPLHRAEITKQKALSTIIMFQTQPIQNSGILRDAVMEYKYNKRKYGLKGEKTLESARKFRSAVLSQAASHLTFTAMTVLANMLLHKMNPYRDKETGEVTKEGILAEFINMFGKNYASAILPVIGSYAISAAERISGASRYDVFSDSVVDKLNTTMDALANMVSNPGMDSAVNAFTDIAGYFGVPAKNAYNIINGARLHIMDAIKGELGSFEAGYDVKATQLGYRIYNAFEDGDTATANDLISRFADEHPTSKWETYVKDIIGDRLAAGEITQGEAEYQLSNYLEMDEYDIQKFMYKQENGTTEGYSKYNDFYTAVETGKDLKATIRSYTDNGVKTSTLASQVTSYFKPQYIAAGNSERSRLKGYLLNAYEQLGYDRAKKSKDIDKWLED